MSSATNICNFTCTVNNATIPFYNVSISLNRGESSRTESQKRVCKAKVTSVGTIFKSAKGSFYLEVSGNKCKNSSTRYDILSEDQVKDGAYQLSRMTHRSMDNPVCVTVCTFPPEFTPEELEKYGEDWVSKNGKCSKHLITPKKWTAPQSSQPNRYKSVALLIVSLMAGMMFGAIISRVCR